jgi:aryl-alcohol dehydrogenase-like predicted oxidoreductase
MSSRWHFAPRRPLGRTGFVATQLGIGDVADRQIPLDTLVQTVRRALDTGLNIIDTAPGYEAGYSEEVVGRALNEHGSRDSLFLIDKIDHMDKPVGPQVDESLARMGLSYTDAFVFHAVSKLEVWRQLAGPAGGMEQLQASVNAGKTRFRGISSHNPEVLIEAVSSGLCDIVLFPVGAFVDERYITQVLPLTRKHNVGTVCFKTFGAGKLVGDTLGYNQPLAQRPRGKVSSGGASDGSAQGPVLPRLEPAECVHYTLTCDPDVALLGMSFPNEQDAAFDAAASFKPLSKEQMADIKARAVVAMKDKGNVWWNP